jgi:hypothetical protein
MSGGLFCLARSVDEPDRLGNCEATKGKGRPWSRHSEIEPGFQLISNLITIDADRIGNDLSIRQHIEIDVT